MRLLPTLFERLKFYTEQKGGTYYSSKEIRKKDKIKLKIKPFGFER